MTTIYYEVIAKHPAYTAPGGRVLYQVDSKERAARIVRRLSRVCKTDPKWRVFKFRTFRRSQ